MSRHIAFAVDENSVTLTDDDRILRRALEHRGCRVSPQLWGEPVVPGSVVIIRSTWNYVEHPARFRQWLDHLDEQGATVHNPTPVLRWNMHKAYLTELARVGVDVVPTVVVARGSSTSIAELQHALSTDDVVIKPAIGGTARLAVHTRRVEPDDAERHLAAILRSEDAIAQSYVPTITTEGELSVVAIAGTVTHVVRKTPAPGDWRVQSDFGGRTYRLDVSSEHVKRAAEVLAALSAPPTYARIDFVEIGGCLHLIELELIEPELFFSHSPESAEVLATYLTTSGDR